MHATIGGHLVTIDTGSYATVFTAPPISSEVSNVRQAQWGGEPLGQCALYGSLDFAEGWFGNAYIGDLHGPDGFLMPGATYSITEVAVGSVLGYPTSNSSLGVSLNQGGIWGFGGGLKATAPTGANAMPLTPAWNGLYTRDALQPDTWAGKDGMYSCNAGAGACVCPGLTSYVPAVLSVGNSFLGTLHSRQDTLQWALTWDGMYGEGTGRVFLGEEASAAMRPGTPKVAASQMWSHYSFTVSSALVNGQDTGQEAFHAVFDTGNPTIQLPQVVWDAIAAQYNQSDPTALETELFNLYMAGQPCSGEICSKVFNLTFALGTVDGGNVNLTMPIPFSLVATHEAEFRLSSTSMFYNIGLPMMRYWKQVLWNFGSPDDKTVFMQFLERDEPILDTLPHIPVASAP